jgi:dihydrofolate reductase
MRKVILSTNVTLDGYMAGLNGELDWHFENWNEKMAEYAFGQLTMTDTILMGRVTYESMAEYWPEAEANPKGTRMDTEFARMMNTLPKIVFSTTLKEAGWNNSRIVRKNIEKEVKALKQQPGKDIIIWGGVRIVSTFISLGLIDEYRIFVAPVVLGRGLPLFKDINDSFNLRLLKSRAFRNGVILLTYEPK